MKRILKVVLLVLLLSLVFTTSVSFSENGKYYFVDGNTLMQQYKSYATVYGKDGKVNEKNEVNLSTIAEAMRYVGYVQSVNDTFPPTSKIFCLPEKTKVYELCNLVGEFLIKHPEKLDTDAAYIIAEAMAGKYQCKVEESSGSPSFNMDKKDGRIEL